MPTLKVGIFFNDYLVQNKKLHQSSLKGKEKESFTVEGRQDRSEKHASEARVRTCSGPAHRQAGSLNKSL